MGYLNHRFVSRQRTSLDQGTDFSLKYLACLLLYVIFSIYLEQLDCAMEVSISISFTTAGRLPSDSAPGLWRTQRILHQYSDKPLKHRSMRLDGRSEMVSAVDHSTSRRCARVSDASIHGDRRNFSASREQNQYF